MMTNNNSNVIFNGKAIRNAILKNIAEDHNLSGSLFSNSNITILVDIMSYMYQTMMVNLKFAAGESMFTDTVLYENATRLAKLIGYYAQGAYPFSLIGRIQHEDGDDISNLSHEFLECKISNGPHNYTFSLVDESFSEGTFETGRYARFVLGEWNNQEFISSGEKYEEFVIPKFTDTEKFISQQFVNVFTINKNGEKTDWNYDDSPLFSVINKDKMGSNYDRLITKNSQDLNSWYRFNFYLDENKDYILKFGDGITSAIPNKDDKIIIIYITSTNNLSNTSEIDINAIQNSDPSPLIRSAIYDRVEFLQNNNLDDVFLQRLRMLPISNLSGFKDVDSTDTIKNNSSQAFNRQQRVVTKSDYKSYLFENDSTVKDCLVQNNWDFTSTFFGYLFNLAKQVRLDSIDVESVNQDENELGLEFITQAINRGGFTTLDAADANNVYIWNLSKSDLGINDDWISNKLRRFGFKNSTYTTTSEIFKNVKTITEHVVEVTPILRTYCPFVSTTENLANTYISIFGMQNFSDVEDVDALLNSTKSVINVYADIAYINNIARIKTNINRLIKTYLYDDIKLGITPSINNLLRDILNIRGVNSVTTQYYDEEKNDIREVQGLQFVSWTGGQLVDLTVCFDTLLTFGLPQINPFEYLKPAIGYDDFINKFIKIQPDYLR